MKTGLRKARALTAIMIASLTAAAGAQGTVNIGFSAPLSGGAAFYGKNVQSGITMAIDEINKAGGITVDGKKVKLNLVALDDRYLPNETATNAKRLLQQSNAPVIFTPHAGGILTLQGFNEQDPKFLIGAYSSEPKILEANNSLTMMIPPRYDNYKEPFVKTTMGDFGKRLGLLPTTSAYGKAWTEQIVGEWKKQGGTVLTNNGLDYNTTVDYSAAVTKTLAEKPDVIFIGGPSQPTALVIKAAREQGYKGGFIVMDQAKFEEMDDIVPRSYLDGSVGVFPLIEYPSPGAKSFRVRYERINRKIPTSEAGLNYMGVYIVAKAMELAGTTTDPVAIRAKLNEAAKSLAAPQRVYNINSVNSKGHLDGEVEAAYFKNGKLTRIRIPNPLR